MKNSSTHLVVATLIVLCLITGCARKPPERPNVILITIDTLRADHVSCYGYERETTPFLDSLAARGSLFRNCHAPSCWTPPSMASIFTSVYPRTHGVRRGVAKEREIHGQEVLDESFLTLAESLKKAGYRTFGLSSNAHMSRETGMAQGFDHFVAQWFSQAKDIHDAALEIKAQLRSGEPYFLWIHYLDPHSPYLARKPWIDTYARHPEHLDGWTAKTMEAMRADFGLVKNTPSIRETLIDLYDSEISHTDLFISRLFDEVVDDRNALVIVSSDHGEAFAEHDFLGHAQSLYVEELKVPLIIALPNDQVAGKTLTAAVSTVDIFPTVLDVLGIEIPAACRGRSVLGLMRGEEPEPRPLFAEFDRGRSLAAIILDDWKLISAPEESTTAYLFDLIVDPREQNNLAGTESAKQMLDRLQPALARWQRDNPSFDAPRGKINLTPDQERMLRSLGYLR